LTGQRELGQGGLEGELNWTGTRRLTRRIDWANRTGTRRFRRRIELGQGGYGELNRAKGTGLRQRG